MLKATFSISMVSKKDTVNLSNMPVKSEVACDEIEDHVASLLYSLTFESKPLNVPKVSILNFTSGWALF